MRRIGFSAVNGKPAMSEFWIGYFAAWFSIFALVAFAVLVTRCIAIGMGTEDHREVEAPEIEPLG
jgi:hypothetical protein